MIRFFLGNLLRPRLFIVAYFLTSFLSLGSSAPDAADSPTHPEIAMFLHILVNEHRTEQGLKLLVFSSEISDIARAHSEGMAAGRVEFSAGGFSERREAIANFIVSRRVAENIAATNHGTGKAVAWAAFTRWLHTEGNRRNIEGDFDLSGIGVARAEDGMYFFTQLLVRRWADE